MRVNPSKLLLPLLTLVISLIMMSPLIFSVLASFMNELEIYSGLLRIPTRISFENYYDVLVKYKFAKLTINTTLITSIVVVAAIPVAILATASLTLKRIRFKRTILTVCVIGATAPEIMLMIPMFSLMSDLGLINNFLSVILPYTAMTICFDMLVLYSYQRGLPSEFIEAAYLDGASDWYLIWRILTPLSKPAIMSAAILTTVFTWNSFILPLVLLPDPDMATLPVGLLRFSGQYLVNVPLLLTGSIITSFPMIIFYLIFQGYVVKGVTFAVRE